jgi:ribosome biogenesis ATPase
LQEAVAIVQPSTKREGFSSIPNVKWEDVGALGSVQKTMEFFISRRIKHPEDYEVLWF